MQNALSCQVAFVARAAIALAENIDPAIPAMLAAAVRLAGNVSLTVDALQHFEGEFARAGIEPFGQLGGRPS